MRLHSVVFPFLLLCFSQVSSARYKDFDRMVKVTDAIQARFIYKYAGEPISRPYSFEIQIKCARNLPWKPLGQYLMCDLKNYEFDAKSKKLIIQYNDGRVEQTTGISTCDQFGEAEFSFEGVCK